MTLNYGIFDVSDPHNPDRVYSAALLSRILSKHIRDGIVHGDGNEMAVTATDPPAMSVQVGTGTAMVQGRFCENDAALTLSVPAAHATYPRIDRVVVRLNASPARTIDILVKKGTPAPSPVPPSLTRAPETWELSLAQIFVAAGATMVQAANITDERGNTSLCGVAAPAYVPSSQLEVVGAVNMQGQALTGLPVPSAATDAARRDMGGATLQNLGAPVNPNDAARKAYVDAKVAGFGISDITIDADKNWNGKAIINLDHIETTRILPVASDETRISGFGTTPVTVPAIYIRGTVRAGGKALSNQIGRLYVNGVLRYSWGPVDYGAEGDTVIEVEGGDVISFTNVVPGLVYIKCSDVVPVTRPESPTWS